MIYRFNWSPEYIEYLTELYKKHTIREISEIIGVNYTTSSKGYEYENVVSCCKNCNSAKMELSVNDFKKHIIKIYEHFCK